MLPIVAAQVARSVVVQRKLVNRAKVGVGGPVSSYTRRIPVVIDPDLTYRMLAM